MESEELKRIDSTPVIHLTDIKNNIVHYLNYLHDKQGDYKGITLWVYDPIYQGIFDETFINDLKCELENHQLNVFTNIDLSICKPEAGILTHKVVEGVELSLIKKIAIMREMQKAIITNILDKKRGTTLQQEYILNPKEDNCRKWFIGRGSTSSSKYTFRENYIIVTPIDGTSLSDVQKECNLHVSSAHAFITYDEEDNNFYFHQDKGGLKCGSFIEKGQTVSPIKTKQRVRLSDNCYLKLGSENHHVLLKVNIVTISS